MKYLAILALAILTGCVTDAEPQPTPVVAKTYPDPATVKAERDASTKVYVLCLARAAKKLDDHQSDPGTIAHAMIATCGAEFEENVNVYSRYLEDGLQGREKVATALRQSSFGSAIQIVLENRKAKIH